MTKDELIDKAAQVSENLRDLKDMVASRAWQKYSDLMQSQTEGRVNQLVLSPLETLHDIPKAEYAKGEIAGIKLCLGLIPTMIESLESEQEMLEQDIGALNEK